MKEEDKKFIENYEELLNKGYCDCNEMNCIDNNSPRRILNIVKRLESNWNELKKWLEEEININPNDISDYDYECILQDVLNKMKELEGINEKNN